MSKIFSNRLTELWKNKDWSNYKRKLHSETIKLKYANDPEYVNKTKHIGLKNGRFNDKITNEYILSEGIKYNTIGEFIKNVKLENVNNKAQFINRRLKSLGYNSFLDYKNNYVYANHKIVDIIDNGEISDVYDLTVDFFENFALECGIIVSNSALDVYADECSVKNEFGDILTIRTDDDKIKAVLNNLFYDILNIEFNIWPWIRTLPVKWDTYIPLLSGENITIKELSDRLKLGNEEYVYSIQDKTHKIVPGKVIWCDKNISENKIVKIVFDDDTFVETAPSHPFILRDGTEIRADELKINDSLMPFYRKLSENKKGKSDINFLHEYELIYDANLNDYDYTHRLIANMSNIKKDKEHTILHHADFNKYNNCPYNLIPMNYKEHKLLHAKHCKRILYTPEVIKKRMKGINRWLKSDEHKKQLQDSMKGIYPKYFEEYNSSDLHTEHNSIRSIKAKEQWSNPEKRRQMMNNMKKSHKNHKVKSIEIAEDFSDVYCMTVVGLNGEDDRHNFAICGKDNFGNINKNGGVFVKNCKYGDHFLKLEISENYGIVNVIPASPYEITREEGFDPENPFRVRFKHEGLMAGQLEYENYEIAHFRLLGDTNFLPYGKCVIHNTHIDTEYGSKFIRDIKVGDKIWTFNSETNNFELNNVLHVVNSGKKEILRIQTPHNFIDSSFNHPILIYDNGKFEYRKSENIKIGDLLIISTDKMKCHKDVILNKEIIQNGDGPKLDLTPLNSVPDIVDNEFAEFCGFMLGDGWLSNSQYNYSVKFSLGIDEFLNDKYISILEKYSGKKCDIQKFKGQSRTAIIYSKALHTILKNNGLSGNSHTKRIPEWVFELSPDKKESFIRGLTNADGSMFTDEWCNRYGIWLSNEELILDFKKLIQSLNIKTSIPYTSEKKVDEKIICGKECNIKDICSFYYYLDAPEKQRMEKYNKLNLSEDSNFILEPVRKIEYVGEEESYDIQVDGNNSNFIANGIIVHNSMIESGRRVWKQLQLMEDAMLIHRIMRAPEKRIFKIDTGNIPPNETEQFIKSVVNKIKKVPYVDPRTGEYNLKFNMMNMTEDFFIPVRGADSGTSVEPLPGLEYNAIEDIEYLRNKMMSALKIPKAFLGYEEGICISTETKIPLLSGEIKTASELIQDYNNNIKNYVYSIDEATKSIVAGEIEWAGITRLNASVVKVTLDNDENIICTPDHNFMLRDGNWVEAQFLKENDSLMPLYLSKSKNKKIKDYTTVYNPATNRYEMVHKLVSEQFNIKQKGKIIHHKDFNKWNNMPENLDGDMTWAEHASYHREMSKLGNESLAMDMYRTTDKFIENQKINGRLGGVLSGEKLGKWIKQNGPYNKGVKSGKYITCLNCKSEFYITAKSNRKFCSNLCVNEYYNGNRYNEKYSKFDIDILKNIANKCDSFKKLELEINVDRNTLNRIFEYNKIDKLNFVKMYMPLALKNTAFINNFKIANHKVKSVEFLPENIDTCDVTIKKYHNFGTLAGVIIHNSGKATLAAEDVRFARTIERIQKIFVSELTKIAIIHLYSQGFSDEDIINFELQLTNPSTIYEQEKIALWQEKVSLIRDMQEIKLLSNEWIYKQIINLADDEIVSEKKKVVDDVKNTFRLSQIETEGNDPFLTNQTFGTPHDLALLQKGINPSTTESPVEFGKTNFKFNWDDSTNKNVTDDKNYDKNYNSDTREAPDSKYGQDSHVRGRDPIGKESYASVNKDTRKVNKKYITNNYSYDYNGRLKTMQLIKESLKLKTQESAEQPQSDAQPDKTYLNEENLLDLQ